MPTCLCVEHHVREGTADTDEAQTLLKLFVADSEGHILIYFSSEALLDPRRARAAAAVVGKVETSIFRLFEDVLVLGDIYRDAALLESYFVSLRRSSLPSARVCK